MRCAIVIPARMASTRFPGKPLCDLLGKPMLQWVYEAAMRSGVATDVVVATPDNEIVEACSKFGCRAIFTSINHQSGTDRIAEVAESLVAEVYINVQGDEPLISQETIKACAKPLLDRSELEMSSCFTDCPEDEVENPAAVKVVLDHAGFALYFSRYPIPYPRNPRSSSVKKHIGIYGFRRETLKRFSAWQQADIERTESLEQLRFLYQGVRIFMSEGQETPVAVDTPEQADLARQYLARLIADSHC